MILAAGLAAVLAVVLAAFCTFADGALLATDPPGAAGHPRLLALVGRRESAHRALALGRVVALLIAGVAAGGALARSAIGRGGLLVVALGAAMVAVALIESVARTAGDAMGARAGVPLAAFVSTVEQGLRPLVAFGSWCERLLERVVPAAPPDEEEREASMEQFREVVEAEADVTRDEAALLRGVFSLGDTIVREIMVPRVDIVGLDRATPWSEVVDRVRSARHARVVVFDGTLDEVVGVLYAKDLLAAVIADEEPADGWLALVRPANFIPAGKSVESQLRDFKVSHRHIAIVVDEYGGTAGLVTLEDALELIVGEIRDENDVEAPEIEREDGDKFWVEARVSLEELSAVTGQDFTRDGVSTLGGLVYEEAGRIPRAGESFIVGNFKLVVERLVRRRVERVYLERLHPVAEDAA